MSGDRNDPNKPAIPQVKVFGSKFTSFPKESDSSKRLKGDLNAALRSIKEKLNDFLISSQEYKAIENDFVAQIEHIETALKEAKLIPNEEKALNSQLQRNRAEMDGLLKKIQSQTQITIPTQINLSTVDFTRMQTEPDRNKLNQALKLPRSDIHQIAEQSFQQLPKEHNEIIAMDFDGTLNIEQKEHHEVEQPEQRGLFGGDQMRSYLAEQQKNKAGNRFYIVTGGGGTDPANAKENLKGTLQALKIFDFTENNRIVSTGTAQTGLKGAFLARRLYENGQLGQDAKPVKITFMDDGINNHPSFITTFMEEALKIELEAKEKNEAYISPSQIDFDCIWIKRPDDNPQAGTDNSHGEEAGPLRILFGAPNPKEMSEEKIEEVPKGILIQGQRFGGPQVDFRTAVHQFQEQTQKREVSELAQEQRPRPSSPSP